MIVMQSLKMMVMSGVVRRADREPPLLHVSSTEAGTQGDRADKAPAGDPAEPGWLARIFLSREHLLRRHH